MPRLLAALILLSLLGLLAAVAWTAAAHFRSLERLRAAANLATEVELLRRQNETLAGLERELTELRLFQEQMLGLAGIEPGLSGMPMPSEGWIWPVAGTLMRGYSPEHPALDLAAPDRQPVLAAHRGRILLADEHPALGLRVVVLHPDSLIGVYGNNAELLVAAGDSVLAGDTLALVGNGPEEGAAHLHFELRRGTTPIDPRDVISKTGSGDNPR